VAAKINRAEGLKSGGIIKARNTETRRVIIEDYAPGLTESREETSKRSAWRNRFAASSSSD